MEMDSCAPHLRQNTLKMLSKNGLALKFATVMQRGDPEIVLAAVSQNGMALKHAANELKGDPSVVMAAVSEAGSALQYASKKLRSDPQIVMRAVSNDWLAIDHAAEALRCTQELIELAVSASNGEALGLRVRLMSGRCCDLFLYRFELSMEKVLRRCAKSLSLDERDVLRGSTLMCGEREVSCLSQLASGSVHELTLVLSMPEVLASGV